MCFDCGTKDGVEDGHGSPYIFDKYIIRGIRAEIGDGRADDGRR